MIFMSDTEATWLVVMMIPMPSDQMKFAVTFDFVDLRSLLMLKICSSAHEMTIFELFWLIGMITCFLEGLLVVMLSLGQALWFVKDVQSGSKVVQSGVELLQSRRELTIKVGNNLGLSLCAVF